MPMSFRGAAECGGAWFDAQYVFDKEARADKGGTGESKQKGNLGRGSEEARYGLHERTINQHSLAEDA